MNTNPTTDGPQFGIDGCTCIPFTRQTNPPRYCQPGDTIDMVTGWERGRDCPHHTPAVSSLPPDQTALRAHIVAAIKASPFDELRTVDHTPNGPLQITVKVDDLADTLMRRLPAVLPPPADRAAVYREAADFAEEVAEKLRAHHEFERSTGALDVMTELRRLAAEAQQPDTETRTSWTPGPVALARAAEWATKRQDVTPPAVPVQPAADGSGEETRS